MRRTGSMTLIILLIAAAACASSSSAGPELVQRPCLLSSADSAHISAGPLYRDCAVDTPAKALATPLNYVPSTRPGTPSRPGVTCYEVNVRFVVGIDGRPEPETVRLVRTNDSALGQSVVQSIVGWRYAPAVHGGVAVRQIVDVRRTIARTVVVTSSSSGSPPRPVLPPRCR